MDAQLAQFLGAFSRLLGWIYTLAWSISFYPQFFHNWKRRSTHNTSVDFCFLNVVGFSCYVVSTASLLYSPVVRKQYADRHPSAPLPTMQSNDLAYGIHALVISTLVYSQFFPSIWGFSVPPGQRTSTPVRMTTGFCLLGVSVVGALALNNDGGMTHVEHEWGWIDLTNAIGYVKILVTLIKYTPQIWINYKAQSTAGWAIEGILLDIIGGVLSFIQLLIDASMQSNWRDMLDNPVKLGLAYISLVFDMALSTQHYILYPQRGDGSKAVNTMPTEHEPLLHSQRPEQQAEET